MLLAIDSGNTNVVFALFDEMGNLMGPWRAASDTRRTAEEYAVWLTQMMALSSFSTEDVDAAIIASVVPATTFNLKTLCRRFFKVEPLVVGTPEVDLGIEVKIDRPEQAGVDRLVNTVAGFDKYGGPLIVIDFGTGTTFDVIDGDGNNCGAVIAPGVNLSLDALYRASAALPRIAIERPERIIGKATIPAMQSGLFWGYVALIEGLVAGIKLEFGSEMKVIATGGLAPLFATSASCIEGIDADLTLRGLYLLYERNRPDEKRKPLEA